MAIETIKKYKTTVDGEVHDSYLQAVKHDAKYHLRDLIEDRTEFQPRQVSNLADWIASYPSMFVLLLSQVCNLDGEHGRDEFARDIISICTDMENQKQHERDHGE